MTPSHYKNLSDSFEAVTITSLTMTYFSAVVKNHWSALYGFGPLQNLYLPSDVTPSGRLFRLWADDDITNKHEMEE